MCVCVLEYTYLTISYKVSGIKNKDLQFYQVSCGRVYEHYCFSKLTIRNEFQHILCAGDPGHLLNMPKLVPKSRSKV